MFPGHDKSTLLRQARCHHASDGIAIGECWLYDENGPIGTSTVAALAQRKPMRDVPPP